MSDFCVEFAAATLPVFADKQDDRESQTLAGFDGSINLSPSDRPPRVTIRCDMEMSAKFNAWRDQEGTCPEISSELTFTLLPKNMVTTPCSGSGDAQAAWSDSGSCDDTDMQVIYSSGDAQTDSSDSVSRDETGYSDPVSQLVLAPWEHIPPTDSWFPLRPPLASGKWEDHHDREFLAVIQDAGIKLANGTIQRLMEKLNTFQAYDFTKPQVSHRMAAWRTFLNTERRSKNQPWSPKELKVLYHLAARKLCRTRVGSLTTQREKREMQQNVQEANPQVQRTRESIMSMLQTVKERVKKIYFEPTLEIYAFIPKNYQAILAHMDKAIQADLQ